MLFNSFEFLVFMPVVFTLYWFVFGTRRTQNLFIVVASYVFYGWWDWRFLALIAFTTACSYVGGLVMIYRPGWKRLVGIFNAVLTLGILGVFKYFNFFAHSLLSLMSLMGMDLDWCTVNVVLPVGISFYTFQALSYTIDVARGRITPTRDIVAFFAYISFFPQLVAGPIERASDLLPQFLSARRFSYHQAVDGMRQMLWGFFKKMVVADNCAIAVNHIWADYQHADSIALIVGAALFSFQIYGDFSGYSDIAIGCARLFGIRLSQNFYFPYFAHNIRDFWRRWHISLMRWFTDYVYIPLGGSHCTQWKHMRNIFIVFSLSGLWHGANWTFITWGIFHATLLCGYLLLRDKNGLKLNSFKKVASTIATFTLVTIGWIIFRAPTLHDAYHYLQHIFTMSGNDSVRFNLLNLTISLAAITAMMGVEWMGRHHEYALQFVTGKTWNGHPVPRYALYVALALSICVFSGTQSQFIYFQF